MPVIDVSQANAGMVLAADVHDKRGRILIPAGKELTGKYVSALLAWGVNRIEVEGDEVEDADPEVEAWAMEEANEEVEKLFEKANRGHPVLEGLFEVCVGRRAARLQAEAEPRA